MGPDWGWVFSVTGKNRGLKTATTRRQESASFSKFAALVSYGLTVKLLKEMLPISQELSTTAIRQRVRQTAERLEDELGEERDMFIGGRQRDWNELPEPAVPLIVGIDGGYVHASTPDNLQTNSEHIVTLGIILRDYLIDILRDRAKGSRFLNCLPSPSLP
jgi:hypothetical protein